MEDRGEFSDSPCAPADSEPETDVVDRHAKSRLETSKHTTVQNKTFNIFLSPKGKIGRKRLGL